MTALPEAIVLFGASGFVGRNLVDALAGRVGMLVGVTGAAPAVPGCTHVVTGGDLAGIPALPADTVAIHVAAYRYDAARFALAQSDIVRFNAELNARVFHFCSERGIREMRMASSVAVYPAALDVMDDAVPVDLNAPPHAGEACYAWSKRWAEILAGLYAAGFGLDTVTFRLSNPYGPYDSTDPTKAHVAPAFVLKALGPEPVLEIRGDASVERDFTYVGDVVEAVVRSLAWRGRSETFNLCTGRTVTLMEMAETILAVAGIDKPIRAGAPGAFGPRRRASTAARLVAQLGVTPRGLAEGLKPTIEWYRHALAR